MVNPSYFTILMMVACLPTVDGQDSKPLTPPKVGGAAGKITDPPLNTSDKSQTFRSYLPSYVACDNIWKHTVASCQGSMVTTPRIIPLVACRVPDVGGGLPPMSLRRPNVLQPTQVLPALDQQHDWFNRYPSWPSTSFTPRCATNADNPSSTTQVYGPSLLITNISLLPILVVLYILTHTLVLIKYNTTNACWNSCWPPC